MARRTIDDSDPDQLFRILWETIAECEHDEAAGLRARYERDIIARLEQEGDVVTVAPRDDDILVYEEEPPGVDDAAAGHVPRTTTVAPVTMEHSHSGHEADGPEPVVGTKNRLTVAYVAAVASMAAVGALVVHAAWQPSGSGSAASSRVPPIPAAAAARGIVGTALSLGHADAKDPVASGWEQAVAAADARMQASEAAASEPRDPTNIVAPITVMASAPRVAQPRPPDASPTESPGARGPTARPASAPGQAPATSSLLGRDLHESSGVGSGQGRMVGGDAPPGSMEVEWRGTARSAQPSTEAQMRPNRLRFNRSWTGARLNPRQPRRP